MTKKEIIRAKFLSELNELVTKDVENMLESDPYITRVSIRSGLIVDDLLKRWNIQPKPLKRENETTTDN